MKDIKLDKLKVVLLHDWLTGFRGGERVFEVFCEMFPNAPIYTLFHKEGSTSDLIEKHPITSSFLNKLPFVDKHYRKLLPLFPWAADQLRIIEEDADLVISSSHCVIKGVRKPSNAKHLSYIHSPMRYMYDQFTTYFGSEAPRLHRIGAKFFRPYLTNWDLKSNKNVDLMVANSKFVQNRINTYYKTDSLVIHPFVELKDFRQTQKSNIQKQDYYLMVSAFAPNKRLDLAIDAFNFLRLPLRIIGGGQQEEQLKEIAGPTIQFLGQTGRDEIIKQFAGAKAFIFPGVEDFGITPLESLASGTPVIAYKKGGVLETLNDDVAIFFDTPSSSSLCDAVLRFETKTFQKETLFSQAEKFSKESFKIKIETAIKSLF